MDITILDTAFNKIGILDVFESFIWVERYSDFGDFEIYTPVTVDLLNLLQEDRYLQIPDSTRTMIIESIEIKTDTETGNKLVVKGRSIESILDRRIVFRQTILDGTVLTLGPGIWTILNESVIDSIYPERNFPNFVFNFSMPSDIYEMSVKAQFYYDYVSDCIKFICDKYQIGFKIELNASNQYVFSIYRGSDRSYAQSTNPFVIFSPDFDNLIRSDYFHTKRYKKNYALMRGDPLSAPDGFPGYPLRGQAWTDDVGTGLGRREMFVDASDMTINIEGTTTRVSDSDYLLQLKERGLLELAANGDITSFDGQIDTSHSYVYQQDYFLGDIVQIENEYGITGRVRITEITFSENLSGKSIYPTYVLV